MIKTEKALFDWLKRRWPNAHFQRIETSTGAGVPDVAFCDEGGDGWIELKVAKYDKKTGRASFKLRAAQSRWLREHVERGGRAAVVFAAGDGVFCVTPFWWAKGRGNHYPSKAWSKMLEGKYVETAEEGLWSLSVGSHEMPLSHQLWRDKP